MEPIDICHAVAVIPFITKENKWLIVRYISEWTFPYRFRDPKDTIEQTVINLLKFELCFEKESYSKKMLCVSKSRKKMLITWWHCTVFGETFAIDGEKYSDFELVNNQELVNRINLTTDRYPSEIRTLLHNTNIK